MASLPIGLKIEITIAVLFVLFLAWYLFKHRKHVAMQKILGPFIYIFLLRRTWGLKAMDYVGKNYRESVKLFGYIGIGVGFASMVLIVVVFIQMIWAMVTEPEKAQVALALPFVNIPGFGFLGFTHWIFAISFLIIVHEFAHGIVVRAHKLKVKSSGLAVFGFIVPLFPGAFVEPDEKQLSKQSDVIQYSVYAAGSFMNLLWFGVFLLIMLFIMNPIHNNITEPIGFSFTTVEGGPAENAGLAKYAMLNQFEGEEVQDVSNLIGQLQYNAIKPGDPVNVGYYNESTQTITEYSIITAEHPEVPGRAYLGINDIKNEVEFKPQFQGIAPYFIWLKDLVKWLVLFNFMVGIFNMLPMMITDGGHMFRIALTKILGNEKKAMAITAYIGLFAILVILAGIGLWLFT